METFKLSGAEEGDVVAVLSETQSREVLVKLSELALLQIGAKLFHVKLPTPPLQDPVPMRSTGATPAVQGIEQVISALSTTKMVVDCTVEGMLHAPELPAILAGGTRLMMISNEHPEILERCMPNPALKPNIDRGLNMLSDAKIESINFFYSSQWLSWGPRSDAALQQVHSEQLDFLGMIAGCRKRT